MEKDCLAAMEQILAQSQLLMLRAQINPDDPTLVSDQTAIVLALCEQLPMLAERITTLSGIIFDLCETIDRLTASEYPGGRDV